MSVKTVVLSGASGFVGGRLLKRLVLECSEVRCLSRDPESRLSGLPEGARAVRADLLEPEGLIQAFEGVDVAYYLVHALGDNGILMDAEIQAARNFGRAAAKAGVKRIIYLGALAQCSPGENSAHIQSRHAVGRVLRESEVPVTEFRASIVIGNGSMPFEVVRALVERLPLMIMPRWVSMRLQPIGVKDVVAYLLGALEFDDSENQIYEIGGRDVVTYEQLLRKYAVARELKRFYIRVPVVTPRLSSHWLRLVTPAHFKMARRIVESAGHDSVVRNAQALVDFAIQPLSAAEAVDEAIAEDSEHWAHIDRVREGGAAATHVEEDKSGNTFFERRNKWVNAKADHCFDSICFLGGAHGWYWGDWLWQVRGAIDRVVGGPGLRRDQTPRRRPESGAILDFWTVERFVEGERMTLRADMKLPGSAWLDFYVKASGQGTEIQQTVVFASKGLFGELYWKVVQPIHAMVFNQMLKKIGEASVDRQGLALANAQLSRGSQGAAKGSGPVGDTL